MVGLIWLCIGGPVNISAKPLKVQLGPRPYFLVDLLPESALKEKLAFCQDQDMNPSLLSIGHRGAPLQFPEHTAESYKAAARQGAGKLECDVTFTKDRQLVCRHAQCDLHTTTNILMIPELAAKCSKPFVPATFDPKSGALLKKASAKCCTTDIILKEFKTLCGKMDAFNPNAKTPQEFLAGTAPWRTDLYATCGTVLTHKESIQLFKELDVAFIPELKSPQVPMPYGGSYSQEDYAKHMIQEYKDLKIPPQKVWAQSFKLEDIRYWITHDPEFGKQAVFLDSRPYLEKGGMQKSIDGLKSLQSAGIKIVAPPLYVLLQLDSNNAIVPSPYAMEAQRLGLQLFTWTLERSGPLVSGGGWYHQTIKNTVANDGDIFRVLDALVQQVNVKGIFSDWPATVTYYANCLKWQP